MLVPAAGGDAHERLVYLLDDPDDQRYVVLISDTCATLHDVTRQTAYGAWRQLGARLIDRRRVPSNIFKIICDRMTSLGLSFADATPTELRPYTMEEARQKLAPWGLTPIATTISAKVMVAFHLNDLLLEKLTDEEICSLKGGGSHTQALLKNLRNKLLRP